jgi:hypothetical protein
MKFTKSVELIEYQAFSGEYAFVVMRDEKPITISLLEKDAEEYFEGISDAGEFTIKKFTMLLIPCKGTLKHKKID